MRRILPFFILVVTAAFAVLPAAALLQGAAVTAEAVGQANLRAAPDVAAELVGQIETGTRYAVIGRSEFYPWYLLADPAAQQPIGWVFADLVTVQGDTSQLAFSTVEVGAAALVATPTPGAADDAVPVELANSPTPDAPPSPTLSAPVVGTVLGEINIRYGPGTEYPRIGIGGEGDQFEITAWHTQLPWVTIHYPGAPNEEGWVAVDLLEISGDLTSLPSISSTTFNLPTLTPTASVIQASAALGGTPVAISPSFQGLGDQIWQLMLDAQFETGTSRLGALYLLDLQTGEALSFGGDIAFSGMSLNKIPILAALYGVMNAPPDNAQAFTIAEAMICSENISTNELLSTIGDGSPWRGAQNVTSFLQTLGLTDTFITAPYGNDPFITPEPVSGLTTSADQVSAEPDPFNQATVDELGGLLGSMYQCGYNESGPLLENFPGQYTPHECRQMIHAMNNNRINALFESGLPEGASIAHKHGWIEDTHGDAGIIFTPGGDYVMVVVVHNPVWMDYGESFPLLGEISRAVYNYYNPDAPIEEIRPGDGAEQCELLGNPLIEDLMSSTFEERVTTGE